MRVEGGTSNIINGVSRQPSEIRLTSQLEESVNQFPTLTRGLVARNPTLHRAKISNPKPADALTHLVERDANEKYVVTIAPSGIEVHDLAGNAKTVHAPDGYGYLAGATLESLEALSVADHTFILNKSRVVKASTSLSSKHSKGGLVHVVMGDYHTSYIITVNGTVAAHYETSGGPSDTQDWVREAERAARPRFIAGGLAHGWDSWGSTTHTNLTGTIGGSFNISRYENVIYLERKDGGDFALSVDADGTEKLRAHKGVTAHFAELPRRAPENFTIKISGSEASSWDDYYVRFEGQGSPNGVWKETLASEIPHQLDASTMPHILVREADGSFTYRQAVWGAREVGDLETNPWPSFVGNKINGMIFFKNRMGFFSGESVALSRNDDTFNFFIESVLTTLDTDPIDVTIAFPDVSDIYHGVPMGSELLLFTSSAPFRLSSNGELLTPKSVSIEPVLEMKTSSKVRPVVAGDKCYFVNDKVSGAFVHELTFDEASGIKQAPTLNDHVQGYIPSGVHLLVADDDLKILAVVSHQFPSTLYIYKWLWVGNEKVQAAWQEWRLDSPILGCKLMGEELILVTDRGAQGREILSLNCHEAWKGEASWPFVPLLDRMVTIASASYDAASDTTNIILPYQAQGSMALQADSVSFGLQPQIVGASGQTLTLQGKVEVPVLVGFPMTSYCVLSKFHHRTTDNHGSYGNAIAGMKLTVANLLLETGVCAYLRVMLERDYRSPFIYNFSAAANGTKTAKFGEVVMGKIAKTVSIMARSEDFCVKIEGSSPYPYALLSYRWTGEARHGAY